MRTKAKLRERITALNNALPKGAYGITLDANSYGVRFENWDSSVYLSGRLTVPQGHDWLDGFESGRIYQRTQTTQLMVDLGPSKLKTTLTETGLL